MGSLSAAVNLCERRITMILSEEDLKVLEGVPAGKWHEVMDFARYLIASSEKEKMPEAKQDKPYRSGGWVEGEIWMSDDFNDPMDFVSFV